MDQNINLKPKKMSGLILIISGILTIILIGCIVYFRSDGGDPFGLEIFATITGIMFLILLVVIPVSRIESKTTIMQIEQFEIVIDESRQKAELTEFERMKLLEKVTEYNEIIASWKTKGNYWYNNKWYYHPNCKGINFIK